jgi:hypothetical protein
LLSELTKNSIRLASFGDKALAPKRSVPLKDGLGTKLAAQTAYNAFPLL